MQTNAGRVREFHEAVGAPAPAEPRVPDAGVLELRRTLIGEEYREVMEAIDRLERDGGAAGADKLVELAQELADLLYVTYGGLVDCGVDADAVFTEVHRANLAKARGPRRQDGKALKPADWTPPDVAGVIAGQNKTFPVNPLFLGVSPREEWEERQMDVEETLRRLPLFQKMEPKHIKSMARWTTTRDYNAGQTIVTQGQVGMGLYVIQSGKVKVTQRTDHGEREVREMGPGESFGELSLLDDSPRSATVTAVDPTTAVLLDKSQFLSELHLYPEVAVAILPVVVGWLRDADRKVAELS